MRCRHCSMPRTPQHARESGTAQCCIWPFAPGYVCPN
jgi:hypothetical protein